MAWLEVHGEAEGYVAATGPTVALAKAFSSYCFTHREKYSPLGNEGMGDSFGIKQLPYLLAKYSFPMLRLAGWADLDEASLDTKAAPYKIALRSHWKAMVISHVLSEHEILSCALGQRKCTCTCF